MKRKGSDWGLESPKKRPALELDTGADDVQSAYSGTDYESISQDGSHSVTETPLTVPSTSSRRSRKFPSDLKTIKCPLPCCPKTFNRPARLAAHLRSHNNERPFKCSYDGCDKAYLEEKHLKQHIKGSHTKERKYTCAEPGCGASFTTGTRLRRHADVHTGAERFRCREYPPCDKTFRKHQTLQRHIRTDHLGLSAFTCEVDGCGMGHDTAGALKRHLEREHGEVRFWCDMCGSGEAAAEEEEDGEEDADGTEGPAHPAGFTSLALLNAHVRLCHVSCHFCEVRCGSQGALERHIERYHSGKTVEDRKTVACAWEGCGKKFVKQANLTAHVRTAHEGFRFVCGEVDLSQSQGLTNWNEAEEGCGEGFTTKVKLEQHVRHIHLGMERPKNATTAVERPTDHVEAIVGYSGSRRRLCCSAAGCDAAFIRHSDLALHIELYHSEPGQGAGLVASAPGQQDELLSLNSVYPPLETLGAAEGRVGDDFWPSSNETAARRENVFASDWEAMRQLIDFDE